MSIINRQQIFQVINTLPDNLILEIAEFLEYLQYKWSKEKQNRTTEDLETFEQLADQLADEYEKISGNRIPQLSEYAVSRAGIYEEHP